jgi:hypothetical protein
MKKKLFFSLFFSIALIFLVSAQEKFGKTLNLGLGVGGYTGYYGYADRSLPVINLNYEFDVANDFTIAPFISYSSYSERYYYGNSNNGYKFYNYRQTIIPIGVKGTYYFDRILSAGSHWDFYLGASLGFAFIRNRWDSDYYGDKNIYRSANPVYLNIHLGAEYHFNNKIGAFLDLSTGVSTVGLAFHGLK